MVNTKVVLLIGLAVIAGIASYGFLRRHHGSSTKGRRAQFQLWINEHGKAYGGDHDERFHIWNKNVDLIEKHNSKKHSSYKLAANKFADLTDEEFSAIHLGLDPESSRRQHTASLPTDNLPAEVDWNKKSTLPIKNQGHCGSCWAFSTIGAIENLNFRNTGEYVVFAEQQLVDCIRTEETKGCNGGEMYEGLAHVRDNGIAKDKDYPYTAVDGKCRKEKFELTRVNTGYTHVPTGDVDQLKAASAQGVVSIAVHAGQPAFRFYSKGVIGDDCKGTRETLDHGIILTGYSAGEGYWIVRNSWGSTWGEGGFAKIAIKDGNGTCGINIDNVYPTA